MRQEIIDYCKNLSLGGFIVSNELPFNDSGTVLYLKNVKSIYVDIPQYATEAIVRTLDALSISDEVTTVRLYFSADAKSLPANYDALVSDLRTVKDADTITGYARREVDVETEFTADMLVTQLTFRFTKLT
jgi:hypothetical protein